VDIETTPSRPVTPPEATQRYDLVWVFGGNARMPLTPSVRVGREEPLFSAKRDTEMSRQHFRVWAAGDRLSIEDLQSRNGTFVDGQRITGAMPLSLGSVIRAGGSVFVTDHSSEAPAISSAAHALSAAIDRAAGATAVPVLLLGATGTGKEVAARTLHQRSGVKGDLVAVNCAAISETLAESTLFGHRRGAFTGAVSDVAGVFEQADGGSLFLDELGELTLPLQAKLLRVLETGEIVPVGSTTPRKTSTRIIAATNRELATEVSGGRFREDLYARLLHEVIRLPTLADRRVDLLPLFNGFLQESKVSPTYEVLFAERLLTSPWPLNIRELRAFTGRLCRMAQPPFSVAAFDAAALPTHTPVRPPSETSTQTKPTAAELEQLLKAHGGNVMHAAKAIGKDPRQLYRWAERLGLDLTRFR
jgi:DNA-binding NtrC family response regulator